MSRNRTMYYDTYPLSLLLSPPLPHVKSCLTRTFHVDSSTVEVFWVPYENVNNDDGDDNNNKLLRELQCPREPPTNGLMRTRRSVHWFVPKVPDWPNSRQSWVRTDPKDCKRGGEEQESNRSGVVVVLRQVVAEPGTPTFLGFTRRRKGMSIVSPGDPGSTPLRTLHQKWYILFWTPKLYNKHL